MNDCTPEGLKYHAWILPPHITNELIEMYTLTNAAITERRPVRELRVIYRRYSRCLADSGILHECFVKESSRVVDQLRSGIIKAMLHRINCCTLRCLSGLEDCMQLCCCNCTGAPDNIVCIKNIMRSFSGAVHKELIQEAQQTALSKSLKIRD